MADNSLLNGTAPEQTPLNNAGPEQDQTLPLSPQQPPTGLAPMAQPTTPAGPTPSVTGMWKDVLAGALSGLSGIGNIRGRGGFGSGVGAGMAAEQQQKQIGIENQQRQQQLNFESVQAADTHLRARDEHRQADQLNESEKLDYTSKSAQYQAFLQDNFGIAPDLSFNDSHAEATAGLTTTANNNGGKIPPVATVQQPSADGQHGKIGAYSPSQEKFNQNMSGYRNLINTSRAVQGMPPVDDASFNSMGFKGARDQALSAIEFLKPTPTFSLDKNSPSYLPTVLAQKQQQLQQYQDHKDADGKPDADPGVVSQLENGIDYLRKSWDKTNAMEDKATASNTTAAENAKKPFVEAEHAFQSGLQAQAKTLDRANADTVARNLKADELGLTEKNTYATDMSKINDLKQTLAQAQSGNQAALPDFQTRFAENEIVQGGVKRMNQAELSALTQSLGTYGRQVQAWADKGFKGDLPKATASEMGQLLDYEAQSRTNLFNQRVANIDQTIRPQGQQKAGQSAPVYASAPGKPRMVSLDGGKTWQPTQ